MSQGRGRIALEGATATLDAISLCGTVLDAMPTRSQTDLPLDARGANRLHKPGNFSPERGFYNEISILTLVCISVSADFQL